MDVEWINLVQDKEYWRASVNTIMKCRVPLKVETLTCWVIITFWIWTLLRGV